MRANAVSFGLPVLVVVAGLLAAVIFAGAQIQQDRTPAVAPTTTAVQNFDEVYQTYLEHNIGQSEMLAAAKQLAAAYSHGDGIDLQQATVELKKVQNEFEGQVLTDPADKDALFFVNNALAERSQALGTTLDK